MTNCNTSGGGVLFASKARLRLALGLAVQNLLKVLNLYAGFAPVDKAKSED